MIPPHWQAGEYIQRFIFNWSVVPEKLPIKVDIWSVQDGFHGNVISNRICISQANIGFLIARNLHAKLQLPGTNGFPLLGETRVLCII